jgi:hypothetical protein
VGQNGAAIDVDLISNRNIVAEHCDVLEPRPLANSAVPADNGRLNPGVVLDAAVLQDYTSLKTYTVTDNDVGANGDIGADAAVFANLCGRVDQDVPTIDKGSDAGVRSFEFLRDSEERYRQVPERKSLGCPTSIQKPSRSKECRRPSLTMAGNVSCSMDVGRSSMRLSTLGLRM